MLNPHGGPPPMPGQGFPPPPFGFPGALPYSPDPPLPPLTHHAPRSRHAPTPLQHAPRRSRRPTPLPTSPRRPRHAPLPTIPALRLASRQRTADAELARGDAVPATGRHAAELSRISSADGRAGESAAGESIWAAAGRTAAVWEVRGAQVVG